MRGVATIAAQGISAVRTMTATQSSTTDLRSVGRACASTLMNSSPFRRSLLEHRAILHHESHILQRVYVAKRIAVDCDHVCVRARSDDAEVAGHVKELRGAGGGGANRVHRRHPEFHHAAEFLRDRLVPGEASDIGPEGDLHACLHRLLK